jgi:N-methylhydantoinase B
MTDAIDPITLEVLRHALAAVAEEMNANLVRSAYSPNIKERRDCSSAVFDAAGAVVAQAESIPVHLGRCPSPSPRPFVRRATYGRATS